MNFTLAFDSAAEETPFGSIRALNNNYNGFNTKLMITSAKSLSISI